MVVTRAAATAALFLSGCGLNTLGLTGPAGTSGLPDTSSGTSTLTDTSTGTSGLTGSSTSTSTLTDGSSGATTMSDGSTMPTGEPPPEAATLQLSFSQVKQFDFTWSAPTGAAYYQLLERLPNEVDYVQLGDDIIGESTSVTMPLHFRLGASYILQACNGGGCTDSEAVDVINSMADAVGYFKASNPDISDQFGLRISLSADGNTLAVGARNEDSNTIGNQKDNNATDAGAVYVFVRQNDVWSQQAYLKASNPEAGDFFGSGLAVSDDGNTLAVGAYREDSNATTIDGDQNNENATDSGAVYVFVRVDGVWSQQEYIKASNAEKDDAFGTAVALSADGNTLAVGASLENSGMAGVPGDNSILDSGAVYVFERVGGAWSQQGYLKAANPGLTDLFGDSLALSDDGNTLAAGAPLEDSNATKVGGDPADDTAPNAGAVYVFGRSNGKWSQVEYLKASNAEKDDNFGIAVSMSADGNTVIVGAYNEDSINGVETAFSNAGAAYVFVRAQDVWSQQAYLKASNSDMGDQFAVAVAVSADGDTVAVGAFKERSMAIGIGGEQGNSVDQGVGAAYVFVRSGSDWSQRAYVKAPHTAPNDLYGYSIALSADGKTLAVGAQGENSASVGVGGDQLNGGAPDAGAVYLY
jgi:hypothetical protein